MSDINISTNIIPCQKKKADKKISIEVCSKLSSKEDSILKSKDVEIENKPKFYSRDTKLQFKPSFYTKLIMSNIELPKKKLPKIKENATIPLLKISHNKIKREIKSLDSLALKSFELKSCKSLVSKKQEDNQKFEIKNNLISVLNNSCSSQG